MFKWTVQVLKKDTALPEGGDVEKMSAALDAVSAAINEAMEACRREKVENVVKACTLDADM